MLSQSSSSTGQSSAPCWFVGARTGGVDQTHRFIDEGLWEHDFDGISRVLAQVRSMQTDERIAIKAAYIKKHGLDVENGGNTGMKTPGHPSSRT
ncbi:MAG: hypothetical protein ACKOCM_02245 [Cyanobacteriota bacterium]